jgi:hypothetical protein
MSMTWAKEPSHSPPHDTSTRHFHLNLRGERNTEMLFKRSQVTKTGAGNCKLCCLPIRTKRFSTSKATAESSKKERKEKLKTLGVMFVPPGQAKLLASLYDRFLFYVFEALLALDRHGFNCDVKSVLIFSEVFRREEASDLISLS